MSGMWSSPKMSGKMRLLCLSSPTYSLWHSMLMEGGELNIEVHQKRSQLWKTLTRERGSEEGPMRKAKIKFNDLQIHLSSKTEINCEGIFTSIALNFLRGSQQNLR